jgi:hypothetical protein
MKISINKRNKAVTQQKESCLQTSDYMKPSGLGKSYTEFKSCDVSNALQTLKRFDQKYSLKPAKEENVTPVQTDVLLPTFRRNIKPSSSGTDSRSDIYISDLTANNITESKSLQSLYSSVIFSNKNSRPLSSTESTANKKSFDMSDTFECNDNISEFLLRNPLNKAKKSSHVEMHSKSDNDFIHLESKSPIQAAFIESSNLPLESNDRDCEYAVLSNNSTSKLEVQSEELVNKIKVTGNSLSEGNYTFISSERFQGQKTAIIAQEAAEVPASEKARHQVSTEEQKLETDDKLNNSFSCDSIQEEFSFNLSKSEDKFVNSYSNSADIEFANSEAAHSSKTAHLHGMNFILEKLSDKDLVSADTPTSHTKITIHTAFANAKKATELKSSHENSDVSELSNSSASSVHSHGLFKAGPYKIRTIEDLVSAHEVQVLQEEEEEEANSSIKNGVKDSRENKIMSVNENNINNDTRKAICSESELNSILESEEEINEEIEEENESESTGVLPGSNNTRISYSSVKTNSSYGEMMNALSSHSEFKHIGKQRLSREENISSEKISINSRSLSLQLISNNSKQESSGNEDILSSLVRSESKQTVSTAHESGEQSIQSVKSTSSLDPHECRSLRTNSNKTYMKHLKNIKYCSIGIQTDRNVAYHPLLHAESEIQQSSFSQPVMHSDAGPSHSLQEITQMCMYYPRTEFQG